MKGLGWVVKTSVQRRTKSCARRSVLAQRLLYVCTRRAWQLRSVHVDVQLELQGEDRAVTGRLRLEGDLDQAQRAHLAHIAERRTRYADAKAKGRV